MGLLRPDVAHRFDAALPVPFITTAAADVSGRQPAVLMRAPAALPS